MVIKFYLIVLEDMRRIIIFLLHDLYTENISFKDYVRHYIERSLRGVEEYE